MTNDCALSAQFEHFGRRDCDTGGEIFTLSQRHGELPLPGLFLVDQKPLASTLPGCIITERHCEMDWLSLVGVVRIPDEFDP